MPAPAMSSDSQTRIFISYSHRGNGLAWKARLLTQLAVFEKHHLLDVWHDDEMKLGENWHQCIHASMQSARLAVPLLTDEMLRSPFVLNHEFPELRRRHMDEGLIIAPILCEKCDWVSHDWIAALQIKPRVQTDPTLLTSFSRHECDSALRETAIEIAQKISQVALAGIAKPDQPPSSDPSPLA
jgi:hypothetical protein